MNSKTIPFKFQLTFSALCVLAAGLVLGSSAHAALGESAQTITADAAALLSPAPVHRVVSTTSASSGAPLYTQHEISLPNNGRAIEWSNAAGIVFAVSWQSPAMPPLTILLGGTHEAHLRAQAKGRQGGASRSLHQLSANEGDWVMRAQARPRAYGGFAYLRSQVPSEFDLKLLMP
jgi:hypothetical protein